LVWASSSSNFADGHICTSASAAEEGKGNLSTEEGRLKNQWEAPPQSLKAHRLPSGHLQPWFQGNLLAKGAGCMALEAHVHTKLISRLLQNTCTALLLLLLPVQSA